MMTGMTLILAIACCLPYRFQHSQIRKYASLMQATKCYSTLDGESFVDAILADAWSQVQGEHDKMSAIIHIHPARRGCSLA